MSLYKKHVFVCVNERPAGHPKGCCAAKGGQAVRDKMKELIKAKNLNKEIRINNAGCLDTCQQGVSVVIYPEGIWYGKVTVDDVEEIVEKTLLNDEIIPEKLMPFMKPRRVKKI